MKASELRRLFCPTAPLVKVNRLGRGNSGSGEPLPRGLESLIGILDSDDDDKDEIRIGGGRQSVMVTKDPSSSSASSSSCCSVCGDVDTVNSPFNPADVEEKRVLKLFKKLVCANRSSLLLASSPEEEAPMFCSYCKIVVMRLSVVDRRIRKLQETLADMVRVLKYAMRTRVQKEIDVHAKQILTNEDEGDDEAELGGRPTSTGNHKQGFIGTSSELTTDVAQYIDFPIKVEIGEGGEEAESANYEATEGDWEFITGIDASPFSPHHSRPRSHSSSFSSTSRLPSDDDSDVSWSNHNRSGRKTSTSMSKPRRKSTLYCPYCNYFARKQWDYVRHLSSFRHQSNVTISQLGETKGQQGRAEAVIQLIAPAFVDTDGDPETQTQVPKKPRKSYYCSCCDYSTRKKDHFNVHNRSLRHQKKAMLKERLSVSVTHEMDVEMSQTLEKLPIAIGEASHLSENKLPQQAQKKGVSKSHKFRCTYCDYVTGKKSHYHRHRSSLLHHRNVKAKMELTASQGLDIENFAKELDSNNFETTTKELPASGGVDEDGNKFEQENLKNHKRKRYHCSACNYNTRKKDHFRRHQSCFRHQQIVRAKGGTCILSQEVDGVAEVIESQIAIENNNPCEPVQKRENLNLEPNKLLQKPRVRISYNCSVCDYHTRKKDHYLRHKLGKPHRLRVVEKKETAGYEGIDLNPEPPPPLPPKTNKVKTPKILECTFCNVQFTKKSRYQEHIHSRRHRFTVEQRVSNEGLAVNIDEEAPLRHDGKVVCETCGITCCSNTVYQKHTETHSTNRKRFKCTICDKQYLHESTLREHQQTHQASVICEHCGKAFSTQKRLLYHVQNVHTRKERYRCAKCGAIYFYKHQLTLHQRTHQSSEERVKCGHCGEVFRHESKKLDHIRQVHEGKVIQCPHCPRTYSLAYDLKIHMRQHTGEKPFVCSSCGKGFGYKEHLTRHRRDVCSLERIKKMRQRPSSSHTNSHSPLTGSSTSTQVDSFTNVGREDDNS